MTTLLFPGEGGRLFNFQMQYLGGSGDATGAQNGALLFLKMVGEFDAVMDRFPADRTGFEDVGVKFKQAGGADPAFQLNLRNARRLRQARLWQARWRHSVAIDCIALHAR